MAFNDVEVDLNSIYAVRKQVTVAVPIGIPSERNNKITLRTLLGETTADFTVIFPALVIHGLYNEFVRPGENAVITGEYFKLYGLLKESTTIKFGEQPLTLVEGTDDKLVVKIPEDATENSLITISNPTLEKPIELKYRDRGVPFWEKYDREYLTNNGFLWSNADYITDGQQPGDPISPIGGSFLRIKRPYDAWSWDHIYGGHFDLYNQDVIDHPEDYYVKFEVWTNIQNPIAAGDFIFASRQDKDEFKFRWNPVVGGTSFNTNGDWRTITFDASPLFYSDEGGGAVTLQWGWNDFKMVYQPREATAVDFSVTNFRFVRK